MSGRARRRQFLFNMFIQDKEFSPLVSLSIIYLLLGMLLMLYLFVK